MNEKKLIVVLGMHRSGTSVITRGLQLLGVDLGENLHPAAPDNPKGFWEDRDCLEINEALLNYLGSAYDRLDFAWEQLGSSAELSRLKLKASRLIKKKLDQSQGIWGFKDPRTCRLLSFWQDVFQAVGCDTRYVIVVRNPASVVESLELRNALPAEKSYLLWLQHTLPIIIQTRGKKRVIVEYDQLIESPYSQISRIASALDLPVPAKDSTLVAEFEQVFLDQGLRHTRYSLAQLRLDSRAAATVAVVYDLLSSATDDSFQGLQELDVQFEALQTKLKELSPVFDYANSLEVTRAELWATVSGLQAQNNDINSALAEQNQKIISLTEGLIARDEQLVERENRIIFLNENLSDVNERLIECEKLIIGFRKELAGVNEQLAEREKQIVLLNESLKVSEEQLAEGEAQVANFNNQLNEQNILIRTQEQEISDLKLRVSQILNSSSWKLTQPLRTLRRSLFSLPKLYARKIFSDTTRAVWHMLPLSNESRKRLKHSFFSRFPYFFSWSQAYRSWYAMKVPVSMEAAGVAPELPLSVKEGHSVGDLYVPLRRGTAPDNLPVRLIAFYLPQFHAIAENNEWWGEGFTEWTNVRPARPQFIGHYQPHVPGELGYYNLLDRSVQQRQIALAKLYGIGGFCFYYYWFGGKRLLEKPIENYLADASLDHPFCLCWANENWSRRWDGQDSQILIAQQHSPEDDLAFAADVARYLRDARYIRVNGKPLLIIYRPSLLPDALETSMRWRQWFREHGIGEIYLAYTQSFEAVDPVVYGFDAAIEFPPNNSAPPNITSQVQPLDGSFSGTIYDWSVFPERAKEYPRSPYQLFRGVCPSWDNTARRKGRATVFLNSSPAAYQHWLENAVADTCQHAPSPDERLVFVNAWNEWAEGAHLEPDQRYGYAWLDATRKALTGESPGRHRERILVVSHDAHPHGAQFLALGMVRSLANDLKFDVHTVLLGDGRLKAQFAQYSTVYELFPGVDLDERAIHLATKLVSAGIRRAIVNTTVSGLFGKVLADHGITCISLIHEMPGVIHSFNLSEQAQAVAIAAHRVVFPAQIVEEGFESFASVRPEQRIIRPQGLWRRNLFRFRKKQARAEVRSRLGAAQNAPIVLGVGYADRRKGIDLFVRAALTVLSHRADTLFVWIGHWDEELRREVDIMVHERAESFRFIGYEPDTAIYHAAADVYALASREDPFPNVVLESFDAAVPVVAFAGTGGGAQLVSRLGGPVVPAGDTLAFGQAILELLNKTASSYELGEKASALIDREYAFRSYLFDLCGYAGVQLPKVSVVVPNYNYARYIRQRLNSIVQQTLPIYELIILDDASTDSSVDEICLWLAENNVESQLVVNQHNSGCVYDQWAKGIALAKGDFVWIAEADDLSLPGFLEATLAPMELDAEICLSYCESQQIDELGNCLSENYHVYLADICDQRWKAPYIVNGVDEIARNLAIKNTVPNVSGVLFRRERIATVFSEHLDAIRSLKKAGDWLAYVKTLEQGKIAFSPRALNLHRRHSASVIGGSSAAKLLQEIEAVQRHVANHYQLSGSVVRKAECYLIELNAQFKLDKRASNV